MVIFKPRFIGYEPEASVSILFWYLWIISMLKCEAIPHLNPIGSRLVSALLSIEIFSFPNVILIYDQSTNITVSTANRVVFFW